MYPCRPGPPQAGNDSGCFSNRICFCGETPTLPGWLRRHSSRHPKASLYRPPQAGPEPLPWFLRTSGSGRERASHATYSCRLSVPTVTVPRVTALLGHRAPRDDDVACCDVAGLPLHPRGQLSGARSTASAPWGRTVGRQRCPDLSLRVCQPSTALPCKACPCVASQAARPRGPLHVRSSDH